MCALLNKKFIGRNNQSGTISIQQGRNNQNLYNETIKNRKHFLETERRG
jgi:hypothetical protein